MKLRSILTAAACAMVAGGTANAADTIDAEVLNFSEQDRWVQVTDMVCNTILHQDRLEAQEALPVTLCTDDAGLGKVELYIRIGCSKNQTVIKEDVVDGATLSF